VLQRVKDISYILFVRKHLFILSGHLFTLGNAHECEEELSFFPHKTGFSESAFHGTTGDAH
jgi:hypothetical protein